MTNFYIGEMNTEEPYSHVTRLQSSEGNEFISFAKYTKYYKDLYFQLVAPTLQSNLLTETWQHINKENINSTCNTTYTVEDIRSISINADGLDDPVTFSDYHDHSKFAIGKEDPYVCIGDINRQVGYDFFIFT